jgi:hypothetical protein
MANINLSQSHPERSNSGSGASFDKSLAISIGLIVFSVGGWLGLSAYNASLAKQAAAKDKEITDKIATLENASVDRVIDFQERLKNINEKLTSADVSSQDMFVMVEKSMVVGASLDGYKYNTIDKTLSVKIVSNDFMIAARQVMSFKSNSAFKIVTVTDTKKQENGTVVSNVVISL